MIFNLTDSLCADILFAMENQQKNFALDAKNSKVIQCDEESVDEENIYSLPQWDSADGYALLESFITKFKGIKAYSELKQILQEGRGVFRNFKITLKKYPEVDKRFHSFKNREMKALVYEWYNALRESWGLETLDQDFYEYDDLVLEDFTFRAFDGDVDSRDVNVIAGAFFEELKKQFPGELGQVLSLQLKSQYQNLQSLTFSRAKGFVCRTLSDEFAGCLLYSQMNFQMSASTKTVVLTALFVEQNYRGLGIARELLSRSISTLTRDGIQFFIINNSFVPELLKSTLIQLGFKEKDFAFVLELNNLSA